MKILSALLALILLASCTSRQTQMSLIVPEDSNFFASNVNQAELIKNVTGESTTYSLVFVTLGQPSFKDAVNQIIEKTGGSALVNAQISYITEWYVLFGFNRLEIKSDVIKFQGR